MKTNNIKILDCTLRDGGYTNNWNFGIENSKKIIKLLSKANIDFIEFGFLTKEKSTINQTLFDTFEKIKKFIDFDVDYSKLVLMINYDKFPIDELINADLNYCKNIRYIFKKSQQEIAFKNCQKIKEKGYKLFINPTFISQYNKEELLKLIEKVNKIEPFCLSIVDSMGVFNQEEVSEIYEFFNKNLNKNISICFHSHNNLQLSFSNAQFLIKNNKNRNLIIDSSCFGIGRGTGNIHTELLITYINKCLEKKYNIEPVLKIIEENIKPIYNKTPWGYSIPYCLSAKNKCHPNYAKYLIEKKISYEKMNSIFKSIQDEKKVFFDEKLIEKLYLESIK